MNIHSTDALIVVDVQNDFCPSGSLAVAGGDEIVPGINYLMEDFSAAGATVVFTQDFHPAMHSSFARNHEGAAPFSMVKMPYGEQLLWPDHCVQGTAGADFHEGLALRPANLIIRKGMNPDIDSYSAFYENDKVTSTGLAGYLRDRGVTSVFFVGLAYDFCVGYSALDAATQGFESIVIKSLTRAIAMPIGNPLAPFGGDPRTTVDVMEEKFTAPNPAKPVLRPTVEVRETLETING